MASRAIYKCKIRFRDKRLLETISEALKPEMEKPPTFRLKGTLKVEDDFLVLNVEAKDTVALRAALNAYLRWINLIANILERLELQ